jgi:hypothetical protein
LHSIPEVPDTGGRLAIPIEWCAGDPALRILDSYTLAVLWWFSGGCVGLPVTAARPAVRAFYRRSARSPEFAAMWRAMLDMGGPLAAASWFFAYVRRHPGAGRNILPRLPAYALASRTLSLTALYDRVWL